MAVLTAAGLAAVAPTLKEARQRWLRGNYEEAAALYEALARDGKGELKRYLVTTDAAYRAISQTALSMDVLKSEFDQFASRRRLMVLATCHSGSFASIVKTRLKWREAQAALVPWKVPVSTKSSSSNLRFRKRTSCSGTLKCTDPMFRLTPNA